MHMILIFHLKSKNFVYHQQINFVIYFLNRIFHYFKVSLIFFLISIFLFQVVKQSKQVYESVILNQTIFIKIHELYWNSGQTMAFKILNFMLVKCCKNSLIALEFSFINLVDYFYLNPHSVKIVMRVLN